MKKKPSSNPTAAEMRAIGWANRSAESKAAHVKAMAVACNQSMSWEQRKERGRRGGLAKAKNALARKLAESKKKSAPPKQRKTPGK